MLSLLINRSLPDMLLLEWKKLWPTTAFKVSLGMYMVLLPLIVYVTWDKTSFGSDSGIPLDIGSFFRFPKVWNSVAYLGSWISFFFLPFIAINIVAQEYEQKTLRQCIINGQERSEFLLGKIAIMAAVNLATVALVGLVSLGIGLVAGQSYSEFYEGSQSLFFLFVQNAGYMSFAFMLSVTLRRAGLAFAIFFPYVFFIERIIKFKFFSGGGLLEQIGSYLPANSFSEALSAPWDSTLPDKFQMFNLEGWNATGANILWISIFLGISFFYFKKADL